MSFLASLKKPVVIGMVHFSSLEGSKNYEGDKALVLSRAREDLKAILDGGVDAVLFENNFDTPKFAELPELVAHHFEELVQMLVPDIHIPWGVSALWNDYRFGFDLCKRLGGVMVRVPVFVDSVDTAYGRFMAEPEKVMATRKELHAEHVSLLADVQVKHAKMVTPRPFTESVAEAVRAGADAVIVTGQWTGDPPSPEQCADAQRVAGPDVAILTGSGMTAENVATFLPFLDGCIVGTAFKQGSVDLTLRTGPNIVEEARRMDTQNVKRFMTAVRDTRALS